MVLEARRQAGRTALSLRKELAVSHISEAMGVAAGPTFTFNEISKMRKPDSYVTRAPCHGRHVGRNSLLGVV